MRRSRRNFDNQLDRLLAGDDVPGLGDDVAELVSQLQSDVEHGGPDDGLAASLAVEAREAESAPVRTRSRTVRPLPTRWRRRIMLSTFLSSLFGKLAIGAVALATTTGGLAATGNLPDPAQDFAAEQLGSIGIEIPDSNEAADGTAGDVLEVIENGDPEEGEDFGHDVADTASEGKSSDGLDTAEDGEANADVAEEHTDQIPADTPEQADEGADNGNVADEKTPEDADEGADNADEADEHTDTGDDYRP